MLVVVRPSTSLAGSMASMMARSSRLLGRGSWTMMPSTLSSALRFATMPCTYSVVGEPSSKTAMGKWKTSMPTSSAAFILFLIYTFDAGSSPTETITKYGLRRPLATAASISSLSCCLMSAATIFPSRIIFFPPIIL